MGRSTSIRARPLTKGSSTLGEARSAGSSSAATHEGRRPMKTTAFLTLAAVALVAAPVFAQQQPAKPAQSTQAAPQAAHDHPAAGVVASASAVATVEAIDLKTREVTLKKEDGELVTLVVSEEARNLAQVAKGDVVTVAYEVGLVVGLGPPGNEPIRIEDTQGARAPAGAKPGGALQRTVAVT